MDFHSLLQVPALESRVYLPGASNELAPWLSGVVGCTYKTQALDRTPCVIAIILGPQHNILETCMPRADSVIRFCHSLLTGDSSGSHSI